MRQEGNVPRETPTLPEQQGSVLHSALVATHIPPLCSGLALRATMRRERSLVDRATSHIEPPARQTVSCFEVGAAFLRTRPTSL